MTEEKTKWGVYLGWTIIALIFIAGVWFYFGQSDPQQIYDNGWKLLQENKYPEARRQFMKLRNLSASDPMKVTGIFFVAQTYYRENDFTKAKEFFDEIIRSYPKSVWYLESRYHAGRCLEGLGRYEEAAQIYNSIIKEEPGNRWADFSRERTRYVVEGTPQRTYDEGWKLFQEGKYPEARHLFEQLRNRRGSDHLKVTGTFFVGQTYLREKYYVKAMEYFQEIARMYPKDSWSLESRYHIGVCLEGLGRLEEARQAYSSVIKLAPQDRWAEFSRGRLVILSSSTGKS